MDPINSNLPNPATPPTNLAGDPIKPKRTRRKSLVLSFFDLPRYGIFLRGKVRLMKTSPITARNVKTDKLSWLLPWAKIKTFVPPAL